jgi:hypothetical protein
MNVNEPDFSEIPKFGEIIPDCMSWGSWSSVIGIAAGLWAGRYGVRISVSARDFFSYPKPPELPVHGYLG